MLDWQEVKALLPRPLRIGTRGSPLARTQADMVRDALVRAHPDLEEEGFIEIVVIKTTGDKITDRHLAEVGGKALFAKEIEAALLEHDIDIAVHSLKDMPGFLPDGLVIDYVLPREDARDAFISHHYENFDALPKGAKVGTSSPRRTAQILHKRPDIQISLLRGNVDTRLDKVQQAEVDATFLAVAGLKRLKKELAITAVMDDAVMLPAIGQGAIAIEHRQEDDEVMMALLTPIHCAASFACISAEREVMRVINGSCYTPLAAYAMIEGEVLILRAELFSEDGRTVSRGELSGGIAEAMLLGKKIGEMLLHGS